MPNARTLAAFLAGAMVALPGLALAQAPTETPPVETPPVETPPVETPPVETPPVGTPDEEDDDQRPSPEDVDEDALEAEDADDDGDGDNEVVSALAECLPSGAELHGTGLNKGFFMRQANTGEVSLGDGADVLALASPGDAEAICAAVRALADSVEAPETAKGRPDWARPNHGDGETAPGAHGRERAAEAKADRGR